MEQNFAIQLFENKQVRVVWDAEKEKYYFSIVDIIQVLTDSVDGRKYWNKLKQRLKAEGNESVTNCHQLKLPASDGKKYKTDVADLEQFKGLTKENLRDNMTNIELALNTLAEVATTEISRQRNPKGFSESQQTAQAGGRIAKNARQDLEKELGHSVVSSSKASDYLQPTEDTKAIELSSDEPVK